MLEATIFAFSDLKRVAICFDLYHTFLRELNLKEQFKITNIGRDKSFADDLACGQGIVSMRVGSALRSAEIKPLSKDLCLTIQTHFQLTFY